MARPYTRWCPNGCGKSVVHLFVRPSERVRFECQRCMKRFMKIELTVCNNERWCIEKRYLKLKKKVGDVDG